MRHFIYCFATFDVLPACIDKATGEGFDFVQAVPFNLKMEPKVVAIRSGATPSVIAGYLLLCRGLTPAVEKFIEAQGGNLQVVAGGSP